MRSPNERCKERTGVNKKQSLKEERKLVQKTREGAARNKHERTHRRVEQVERLRGRSDP